MIKKIMSLLCMSMLTVAGDKDWDKDWAVEMPPRGTLIKFLEAAKLKNAGITGTLLAGKMVQPAYFSAQFPDDQVEQVRQAFKMTAAFNELKQQKENSSSMTAFKGLGFLVGLNAVGLVDRTHKGNESLVNLANIFGTYNIGKICTGQGTVDAWMYLVGLGASLNLKEQEVQKALFALCAIQSGIFGYEIAKLIGRHVASHSAENEIVALALSDSKAAPEGDDEQLAQR